jgi:arylsulfatase A-like enzyme
LAPSSADRGPCRKVPRRLKSLSGTTESNLTRPRLSLLLGAKIEGRARSLAVVPSLQLILALVACSGGSLERQTSYYDLVAEFRHAATKNETRSIVFGDLEARRHLVSGWSSDAFDRKRKLPFVWSNENRSVVSFDLLGPRDLEAAIHCRLRGGPRGTSRTATVGVNGHPIRAISVRHGLGEYRISIPADATRAGENLMVFDLEPDPTDSKRENPPRVAWYRLDLGVDPELLETPLADPEKDFLFIPLGWQIQYPVHVEPGSTVRAERTALRGAGGRLEISLETDENGEETIATLSRTERGVTVPLQLESRTPALLTLTARATESGAQGGVLIQAPSLWAPSHGIEAMPVVAAETSARRPNVLLYLVDTLRRDRLGCYGYTRAVSPNIDAFAADSTLFVNTVGQSSWTKPSVASIFSGIWPPALGTISWKQKLPEEVETLAESLQTAGYRTAAFVTNPNVVKAFGFHQGFDDFYRKLKRPSDVVNEMVLEWLDQLTVDAPFFLYVHTMDPHAPYSPPEPFRRQFAPRADAMPSWSPRWKWPLEVLPFFQDLYDGEVAFNDHSFGSLLRDLEARGLYDETLILFVSDHGEEFKEHGRWRHGANLHAETLNFPLIIRFPGQQEGRRAEELAQHIDLMPTVLDYLGLPIPEAVEGGSLSAVTKAGNSRQGPRTERAYSHLQLGGKPRHLSIVDGPWKLIRTERPRGISVLLYNWKEDPREREDLAAEFPVRTAVLSALLDQKSSQSQILVPEEEGKPDEETLDALRALGYLQ